MDLQNFSFEKQQKIRVAISKFAKRVGNKKKTAKKIRDVREKIKKGFRLIMT